MAANTRNLRGEGLIYVGSVAAAYGARVILQDDCSCEEFCSQLDVLDEARRASALVAIPDGGRARLEHARFESFKDPADMSALNSKGLAAIISD
jgi:hypothetical protein